MNFTIGDTVVCSVEVKRNGILISPTSMKLSISHITTKEYFVTGEDMDPDEIEEGKYSYELQTTEEFPTGAYYIDYVAVYNNRVTQSSDFFNLQQ